MSCGQKSTSDANACMGCMNEPHSNIHLNNCSQHSRESYATARITVVAERLRILTLKDSKRVDQKKYLENFRADLKSINKQIDRFNILAPSMVQQLFHYNAENEIDGISKLSVEGLQEFLLQLRRLSCPDDENINSSDKNNNNASKGTNDSTSFKDIWKEWRALFSRSS